jgi:restriction system-associated AAA family ATPase
MRLSRLLVVDSAGAGGPVRGLNVWMGGRQGDGEGIAPLCILGPNGSGKSQFLQLIAEIFQAAWHEHRPTEERHSANEAIQFELEYSVRTVHGDANTNVKLSRQAKGKSVGPIVMEVEGSEEWQAVDPSSPDFGRHLPSLVVGYTSGDNETLSLPFLFSRSGYADDVANAALHDGDLPHDNRMLLIDYGTNLEVLFANLMLATFEQREAILEHARLRDLASCRCIVRLNHSAAPKAPAGAAKRSGRKGIQLTPELELILDQMKRSATCWSEDKKLEVYTFDFFITDQTREAFGHFFANSLNLYRSLHKFSLLNDLAIPRDARKRLAKAVRERRFASRLPEPQQEDLVFGFEEVRFHTSQEGPHAQAVDYVSLSDGEHQQALVLGLFTMITEANALFVLDEPESHFNPQWRIKFAQRILDLPGDRGAQEVLLTSHAPFVPADLPREQVLIFSRDGSLLHVANPKMETFGANFDRILEHCFGIQPPISQLARERIEELLDSTNIEEIEEGLPRLGASVEKSFVADRLRQLKSGAGE